MPMPLSAASVSGTTRTGPTLAGNHFTLPDVRLGGHFRTSTLATTRSALAAWVVPNTPWLEKLNVRSRVIDRDRGEPSLKEPRLVEVAVIEALTEAVLVGEDEADPKAGCISFVSPVARLLMGKAIGDESAHSVKTLRSFRSRSTSRTGHSRCLEWLLCGQNQTFTGLSPSKATV